VAFIYAGNYLLSHTRVGRTLLSAALDLGVLLICFGSRDGQKSTARTKTKNQNQDQLQRLRTGVSALHEHCGGTELIRCTDITDNFLAAAIQ
jgi:hypothetical protein